MEKVNAELLALTYGAVVTQMIADYKDTNVVNGELEQMGYNIGCRLIDEFLAKSKLPACPNFSTTGAVIAKVGFKMFLGINAEVKKERTQPNKQFSICFSGNPLNIFVELPPSQADLKYSNILCGVIRGALAMVQLQVRCEYISCELTGHIESEIRVTFLEVQQEVGPQED
jgi:hypothetical protein